MSFLSTNNSEIISARITQKGRKAIAKGSFNINYFQVGDSEFDYNLLFSGLTGNTNHQMVMSPFDKESNIKYPYKIDSSTSGTTYGVPVESSITESIRNAMGPAGFVTEFIEDETVVKTRTDYILFSSITGGTTLYLPTSGNTYVNNEKISLVFSDFGGVDIDNPIITGKTTSLIYKIVNATNSGHTLELDRELPNFSTITGLTGYANIVANYDELEYTGNTCPTFPIDPSHQHNPWTMDVVWSGIRPIGVNNNGNEYSLSGYTSNKHVSTKEFLGYTSTGSTFYNFTGGTLSNPTSYQNSFGEIINVTPEEQRCIAVIHYSELGDLINDPERFFKYDDYISTNTGDTFIKDENDYPITDLEYFEVYIPFILYHRNPTTGTTIGALFHMDDIDYYIKSNVVLSGDTQTRNDKFQLLFRYLLDEQNNRVGKVFPNNKIIVFDDQELVAILDLRSNRHYTLGAPKVGLINSDNTPEFSLFDGTSNETLWVTYMFSETTVGNSSPFNSLPCNYYCKIDETSVPSNVTVRFSGDTFQYMGTSEEDIIDKFNAKYFYILAQMTDGSMPKSDQWVLMDFTSEVRDVFTTYINPTSLTGKTFTITLAKYDSGAYPFNLDDFMGIGYTSISGTTQFGEEQPFPGSIKLVRGSDIESLNFLVNLPSTQFTTTQNPTYPNAGNVDKRITEIALLDANKEVLVMGKCPLPIKRTGTQVFSLKLDF